MYSNIGKIFHPTQPAYLINVSMLKSQKKCLVKVKIRTLFGCFIKEKAKLSTRGLPGHMTSETTCADAKKTSVFMIKNL